jgi:tRNA G37 N-methylase TrmD
MPLTEQQTRLAGVIDRHVRHVLAQGGGDEALLMSLADHMGTFKQVMDLSTGEEMNVLCQRYDGFDRFAKLLERLAEGIADGSIPVPD